MPASMFYLTGGDITLVSNTYNIKLMVGFVLRGCQAVSCCNKKMLLFLPSECLSIAT